MKILSVKFRNLNSLKGENEISFVEPPISDTGLFAITGDTGAGKSTILDAITLALYGEIHRNKNVLEIMTYGQAEAFSEVHFEVDGLRYMSQWTIWRAYQRADGRIQGPVRKLSQYNPESGEYDIVAEKIREVNSKVDEITGLDFNRFSRSILLSQGDFAAFLKADEKERSLLLERITGTEVYSLISTAAYEKNKEEQGKLKELEKQLEMLELLSEEDISEIQDQQSRLTAELSELRGEIEANTADLKNLERIEDLRKEIGCTQIDMDEWEAKKKNMAEDLERLARHNDTRPFHGKIRERGRLLNESGRMWNDIATLEARLGKAEEQKISRKNIWDGSSRLLSELKNKQEGLFQNLEEAAKLDSIMETKEAALIPQRERRGKIKKKYDDIFQEKEEQQKHIKQENQRLGELCEWLRSHKVDEDLSQDLPKIEIPLESIAEWQTRIQSIETACNNLSEKISTQERLIEELRTKQEKSEQRLLTLRTSYQEIDADDPLFKGMAFIQNGNSKIQHWNRLKNDLEKINDLNRKHQRFISKSKDSEHLDSEINNLDLDLSNDANALKGLEEQCDDKKKVYELQVKLDKYKAEREQLKPGAPCPVCHSTEHPFREHPNGHPDPDLQIAEEEMQRARERLEQFQKTISDKSDKMKELKTRRALLEEEDIPSEIQNIEKELSQLRSRFGEMGASLTQENAIKNQRNELQHRIAQHEHDISEIRRLAEEIQTEEIEINDRRLEEKDCLSELEGQRTTHRHKEEQLTEGKEALRKEFEKIGVYLEKYGLSLKDENLQSALKERRNVFVQKKDDYEKGLKEVSMIGENVKSTTAKLKTQQEELDRIAAEDQREQEEIKTLQTQRADLLPLGKAPETERQHFLDQIKSAERKEQAEKQEIHQIDRDIEQQTGTLAEKRKSRTQALEQLEKTEIELRQFITTHRVGITMDNLEKAILPNAELNRIELAKRQLDEQFIRLKQKKKTLEEEKEKLEEEVSEDLDMVRLRRCLSDQNDRAQTIQEDLGRRKERLETNSIRQKNSKALSASLATQLENCQRWVHLNDLIGQQDGKKFRVFAQGLTLKRLTDLANLHLAELNERYRIHKPLDRDLELEIIDTYQANHSRSANTLSGGESFLVSLALALGLSDLAGRNARIGSLFIDEGFGTLDNDTLEIALQTLEKLQHTGKTIGVISHVAQLKERIGTQIRVEKQGNGYSTLNMGT